MLLRQFTETDTESFGVVPGGFEEKPAYGFKRGV